MSPPIRTVAAALIATVALAAISTVALASLASSRHPTFSGRFNYPCTAPALSGSVINVTLTNMGGPMMGGGMMDGGVRGGMMRLSADRSSIPAGPVSFIATNIGSINHELVVLPLPADQIVGTRVAGSDGKIDESASAGEASNTCASGAGQGIAPGASSWVTIILAPGRYELVCNLPGHYAAGMSSQITVA